MKTIISDKTSPARRFPTRETSAGIKKIFRRVCMDSATWLIMLPALLFLFLLVWRPMFLGLGLSFFKLKGYVVEAFVGFDNYINVVKDPLFIKTLGNTFLYAIYSLIIGYPLPIITAVMLNEIGRGQNTIKTMLYLPTILPGMALLMIWSRIYRPDMTGLLNQVLAFFNLPPQGWLQNSAWTIPLIIITKTWQGWGSTTLLYLAGLRGIDQQLYEAARIDGAGAFKRIFSITIPQIAPLMSLLLIQQFTGIFQIMMEPFAMTGGGPNNASLSIGLTSYFYAFQLFKTENALALGSITFVILLTLTMFYLWVEKKINAD